MVSAVEYRSIVGRKFNVYLTFHGDGHPFKLNVPSTNPRFCVSLSAIGLEILEFDLIKA